MRRDWTLHSEYEAEVDQALEEDEDSFDSDADGDDSFAPQPTQPIHYRTGIYRVIINCGYKNDQRGYDSTPEILPMNYFLEDLFSSYWDQGGNVFPAPKITHK